MISEKEFKYLYETSLENQLLSLEHIRKNMKNWVYACGVLFILVFAFTWRTISHPTGHSIATTVALFIAFIALGIYVYSQNNKYRKLFKKNIVAKIVAAFDSEWKYSPEKSVSQKEYDDSKLFPTKVDHYDGDDLIEGSVDGVHFSCSEVHSQYDRIKQSNDNNNKTQRITIFKGLYFHANFNTLFDGSTHIKSNGRKNKSKGITSQEQVVEIAGNITFKKKFTIYSTNPIEAKRVITPSMTEALLKIEAEHKNPINIAFRDNRIYVTVSFKKDLFEPRILKSGVNYEDVLFMYKLLALNYTIIKDIKF